MTDKIVVFTTCGSEEEASRIAEHLVQQRLAACVSFLPALQSVYHWRGAIERSQEFLLIIKSTREKLESLEAGICKLHSYEVPEIIAVPVVAGAAPYLEWMDRELARSPEPG